jgi:hypothetical protein
MQADAPSSSSFSIMSFYENRDNPKVVHTWATERLLYENLYNPTEDSVSFYKTLTRISDDEELKRHIIAVQTEAYKVRPGPSEHTLL